MKTTTLEVTILEPNEGEYLTQTNLEEGADRTFSKKVFLAQDAMPSDWRAATQEEKDAYDAEQAAKFAELVQVGGND